MTKPLFAVISKSIAISFIFPISMGLLGLILDATLGGLGRYLNLSCFGFIDCIFNPAIEYLMQPKTWKLLLLCWGIGILMVCSIAYQNLKPWIHEWFSNLK